MVKLLLLLRKLTFRPSLPLTLGAALWATGCQTAGPQNDPNTPEAVLASRKTMVRSSIDTGQAPKAIEQLRELVIEFPKDPEVHTLLGLAQLTLKNASRASQSFRQAYKLAPTVANGLNLATAMIEIGDHEPAIKLLRDLLAKAEDEKYRHKERILHNIGYAYAKQRRWPQAERWLKLALEESPTFYATHLELGRIYKTTGRHALSMHHYRLAIDYCTYCYEPVQNLASLLMAAKKQVEARQVIMSYLRQENIPEAERQEANKLLKIATLGQRHPRGG